MAAERSYKFMQSLDKNVFRQLKEKAVERGVTVQELIRAVIIPEWMRLLSQLEAENSLSNERQRVWVR